MTFGEKLKMLRYEKGLTQDDMGYLLNVTKSCISCYENGSRQPSLDILIQLAAIDKSVKSLASVILESHMKECMVKSINEGKMDVIDEIVDLFKRFN